MFPVGHHAVPHLILVLTDPTGPHDLVVVTAVVSVKPHTDKTVTLLPGDHPFLLRQSNVDYGWACFKPAKLLASALLKHGERQQDMSDDVLARVRAGLLASSRTPNEVLEHCRPIFAP